MTRIGDPERDRAVRSLRRHYAEGRLDDDELAERLDLVLAARSRWQIAYALRGLPWLDDVVARIRHRLLVAAAAGIWALMSVGVLGALVWAAVEGSVAGLAVVVCVWLVSTAVLYRRTRVSARRLHRR